MVNFKKVGTGIAVFFIGYLLSVFVQYIIPPLIDSLPNSAAFITNIGWMAIILVDILAMIVVPMYFVTMGILEKNEKDVYISTVFGILTLFFGMLILIKMYFIFPAMAQLFAESETIALGSYWVGIILLWVSSVFIAPAIQFVQAKQGA